MTAPAPAALIYSPRATCDTHLQALASTDDPNSFLDVGQQVQCPECGRTWAVVETVTWCSPVQVTWQCTAPPPADWTPPADDEETS